MAIPVIHRVTTFEDSGIILMARVIDGDGNNIQIANISSIIYSVRDKANSAVDLAANSPLTVAEHVFDVPQTPEIWTADTHGYNFRYDAVASEIADGDKTYRFEFKFQPASGQPFYVAYDVNTVNLLMS